MDGWNNQRTDRATYKGALSKEGNSDWPPRFGRQNVDFWSFPAQHVVFDTVKLYIDLIFLRKSYVKVLDSRNRDIVKSQYVIKNSGKMQEI